MKLLAIVSDVICDFKKIISVFHRIIFIYFFFFSVSRDNYKLDENILETYIQRNIFPTDRNKNIKLIIYNNKSKTSNFVINNNSSLSIRVLLKTNVIYQFKSPLGDCIFENKNIYVGLTSTTLSR